MKSQSLPLEKSGLPFRRACELETLSDQPRWLIEGLWAEQAVGILGGQPKCCKSFMALDMAVSVASATPCLRRFAVGRSGPVLLFPAEDALEVVRQRLAGICAAARADFNRLPVYVITAPRLLLDVPQDRIALRQTINTIKPVLLILDPLIRMHSADENVSKDVAPILGYLRQLQREFHMAVMLGHHARKRSGQERPGQMLRGSSDLHGWGDSNLYLRRNNRELILSIEHRAAPAGDDITLELTSKGNSLALSTIMLAEKMPASSPSPTDRVLEVMTEAQSPMSTAQLRSRCRMRTQTVCEVLAQLRRQQRIIQTDRGYQLNEKLPDQAVSLPCHPIGAPGKGNEKQDGQELPLCS